MPKRITTDTHQWMGATTIPLPAAKAKAVAVSNRTWETFPGGIQVKVIDAYCGECGAQWGEGQHVPCPVREIHEWVGAALIPLDQTEVTDAYRALVASWPGYFEIDLLTVYCDACRRDYSAVADAPCESAFSNDHLRGGPIGTRAKRGGDHHHHDCEAVDCPGPDSNAV